MCGAYFDGVLAYHYYIDNPNKEYVPRSLYENVTPINKTVDSEKIT